MEGSDRMHNGPRGVWRQYYTIDEANIVGSALDIISSILDSDHELIERLIEDEYFLELTYRDDDFEHIQFPTVNPLTVSYKVDLHTAQCALNIQQVCSELINNDSIIVIGDLDTYNQVLGNA